MPETNKRPPIKGTPQIDIRDGEFFYFQGTEIKKAIDARVQSVLRPAYEEAMGNITRLIGESPDDSVAALIVALQSDSNDWNAATSEIHRNAEIATEHHAELMALSRMAVAFSNDAQYIVSVGQLKRYGLGS